MSDQFIKLTEPSTGSKKLDTEEVSVAGQTVQRERLQITGIADTEISRVRNDDPVSTDHGVVVRPRQWYSSTVTAPAQTSVGMAAITLLSTNAARRRVIVQNTGTTVIKLTLGATSPTQTEYHIALAGGTNTDDGLGGAFIDDAWNGQIKAISSSAGGTVVVTETT